MEGIIAFLAVVRSRGSGPFCGRQLPGLAPQISLDSRLARSWGTVTGWEFEATGGRTGREELPDLVKRDFSAEGPTDYRSPRRRSGDGAAHAGRTDLRARWRWRFRDDSLSLGSTRRWRSWSVRLPRFVGQTKSNGSRRLRNKTAAAERIGYFASAYPGSRPLKFC